MVLRLFDKTSDSKELKYLQSKIKEFRVPIKLRNDQYILVMTLNNEYVSMTYYHQHNNLIEICFIHTDLKFRKQGHSLKLVSDIIKKSENINYASVIILPGCGSDKLFTKLGFTFVGENHMELIL
jgi:predicted GNAT family acetyltransferase